MPRIVSPGLSAAKVHRLVRLRARMRLDVGVLGAEQLLGAIDRELLGDVDELAAAVVALARIAFGVLVGELRALRREDRRARVVFRKRSARAMLFLAPVFGADRASQSSGIDMGQGLRAVRTWRERREKMA